MEGMKDWEPVDQDGTLKRFKIDGGWIYALVDWVPCAVYEGGNVMPGYWRIVNGFFVEEKE